MRGNEPVNILLVDDQPSKLLSYEVILSELGERLIKTTSAREALEFLLKNDVAVVLMDVCMPELDGFELASMIRDHPRFRSTAIIFISAIHVTDLDHLRGYQMGAVDYVPVPVVPEVLRAKVRVFADLHRKTRQLEDLNNELERRVAERTRELEASSERLRQSEERRTLALAAGQMGSWDWDLKTGECTWDEGQCRIFGVDPATFRPARDSIERLIHPEDWQRLLALVAGAAPSAEPQSRQIEFRVRRPSGEQRWCHGTAVITGDGAGGIARASGVTIDITDRKQAEEHQLLLAREVDHRARNALAVVQSIVRLTRARTVQDYVTAVEGRIRALARAHNLLSESRWQGADLARLVQEELAPFKRGGEEYAVSGPPIALPPTMAQTLALALHELATNAAKYGALSAKSGLVGVNWGLRDDRLELEWIEAAGPQIEPPSNQGFGMKVIAASIERQLGGAVYYNWCREGLRCTLSVPYELLHQEAVSSVPPPDAADARAGQFGIARQVLLVEDEALVGMMMRDVLTEMGLSVLGPFGTASEALSAANQQDFDCAILDVNVGGEFVYPVADVLVARDVPFIFITGYDAEGIESRFAHVPSVRKPVQREMLEGMFAAATQRPAMRRVSMA